MRGTDPTKSKWVCPTNNLHLISCFCSFAAEISKLSLDIDIRNMTELSLGVN